MQLLIILALLLYGGKANAGNLLEEVKPVLEEYGGEQIKQALKSAEELSSVLSVVQTMANAAKPVQSASGLQSEPAEASAPFPLAPVSAIADKDITYSLSRYINSQASA